MLGAASMSGQSGEEEQYKWRDKIKKLYDARNLYIHRGSSRKITVKLLHQLDVILINVIDNIAKNLKHFNSRAKFEEYAERARARRVLGISNNEKLTLTYRSFNSNEDTPANITKWNFS